MRRSTLCRRATSRRQRKAGRHSTRPRRCVRAPCTCVRAHPHLRAAAAAAAAVGRDKARIDELMEELDLLKQARREDTDRFKKTLFDIVNFANTKNYTEVANYTIDIIASIR